MQATKTDRGLYRWYYRLMNLCLLAGVVLIADAALSVAPLVYADGSYPAWYLALGYIGIFLASFVAPVLVVARFMRDEYAEQLFHRTTDVMIYVAVAVPFVIFAAAVVVYAITSAPEAPYPFNLFMEEITVWKAMWEAYEYFCLLFVFIFQFLRWKDSR
ncbi:hypothetical protein [Aurantiacibacter zhengii]|uniref:Uncharacterized protein n=1 Tax=Aurantiacibacter zhengii TaxID=2307003 RepID=A0A418NW17_9SPHN|nr:hypothetical protein [Aurantiacibacter zhengii]RIV88819.1 hypothetical protein D2V07_00640 [Aurantiacibacter zhengii]